MTKSRGWAAHGAVFIDSFSGAAADLKKGQRSAENVLAALRRDPRVSTWDMSEHPWLASIIADLQKSGAILSLAEPYPWHRFHVVTATPD